MIYFSHPVCQLHDNGGYHPESAERITRIEDALISNRLLEFALMEQPRKAEVKDVLRVHTPEVWQQLVDLQKEGEIVRLDEDTAVSPHSLDAALYASGAVLDAIDALMDKRATTAFCNIRPPGHHAEVDRAMGFCLVNHVAIGAAYALEIYGLQRVAILDFDVHHGNGTESYAEREDRVLFCSSFEVGIYPFSKPTSDKDNIIKMPLHRGDGDRTFLDSWEREAWPKIRAFKPELIIVSAGFDAHRWDHIANLDFSESGYGQWTHRLRELADELCEGKIVSVLEGGYDLNSLSSSVVAHYKALADL